MAIKFSRHFVTDGTVKARIFYSRSVLLDGRRCITLYAKDYSRNLGRVFADAYENQTDSQSDYFDQGHVRIFPGSPHYAAVEARAQLNEAARAVAVAA